MNHASILVEFAIVIISIWTTPTLMLDPIINMPIKLIRTEISPILMPKKVVVKTQNVISREIPAPLNPTPAKINKDRI